MPNYTNNTGTGFDWQTYSGGHQFSGQAKEEFLKKWTFGSMGTFGISNVLSTTFFASMTDVAANSNTKANAAEKLKEKQQCLEAIKIALDQSKKKRDEQVGLIQSATKILERLNKGMEELKLHKTVLVPNEEAMADLETLIQIRKEALKDMGLDIEVHNHNNLDEEAAQLHGQHDTLLWEVEVATWHLQFVETIINLFKSRMPILPVRPPVHLGSNNSYVQLGDCVACGMSIMQTIVTGVYMLRRQHLYHLICFVIAYSFLDHFVSFLHVIAKKDPMASIFGSLVDGIAHSQAGSSCKPNIDSMCGGCRDKNASQKQAGEDTPDQQKAKKRAEKRADVVGAQGDASKESAEVPLKLELAMNKDVEVTEKSSEKPIEKDITVNLSNEDADLLILDVCGEILGCRKKKSNTEERAKPKKKAKVASEPLETTPGGKKSK
ncbi:hypothetical protein L7F22_009551 [Adiantum nelumboides]|nr:hypothetical protein [Adiantum nelumboides]